MLVSFECIVVVDEREATHPVAATRMYCEREGRELCFFLSTVFKGKREKKQKNAKTTLGKKLKIFSSEKE